MLAGHLGRDLSEIDAMPAAEFARWMAYYQIEPFGVVRDNFHFATLCATMVNIHRNPKSRPVSYKDFMLQDPATRKAERIRELMQKLRGMAENGD